MGRRRNNAIELIDPDTYRIDVSTDTHPDAFMLIDVKSYDELRKWTPGRIGAVKTAKKAHTLYAQVVINGRPQFIHRVIFHHHGMDVDHVNGDGLDNRLVNLRAVAPHHNSFNRRPQSGGVTGYKGVRQRSQGSFSAHISARGNRVEVGGFKTPEAAAIHRQQLEQEYHGEYAGYGTHKVRHFRGAA